ncbi:MAG: peptidyl-prolyl cis-trans isomerase [Alphaproteobacteria bacterium]|nr:peptidyl-prolyl cis-trans isomerase [Alphaproteobacteria bacterium]
MNKVSKLVLFSALVATAGFAAYKVVDSSKAENSEQKNKKSKEISGEKENKEQHTNKETIVKESDAKSTEETAKEEKQSKAEENPVSAEQLNAQSAKQSADEGKTVVLFRDGTKITDAVIKKEIDEIPEQLSAKMSLAEIRSFLAWKNAYKKVITEVALRSGVAKSKEISDLIEKRKRTVAGFMLLDDKSKELMTFEALKENYDKVWDKNFKGTKEFSLIAVTTADKNLADRIKNEVKSEEDLKKIAEANPSKINKLDMDSRPQGIFPSEVTSAVLKQGAKTIVGPFELKGSFMFFYVKSINDAKKQDFTEEFAENYKKVASRDFIKQYTKELYKKYEVQIRDVNDKVVDPFELVNDKVSEKEKGKELVKLSKLKDDAVLATYRSGKFTVKELKEFYKVDTLLDKTFVAMTQQFNLPLDRVIIYAVKLAVDDIVLSKEVEALNYRETPKVAAKLQEVGNMEIQHAYFKDKVKVNSEDVKITYNKFIKSIPEEDKNDNEISARLAFYETREDAALALKAITSGEEKFSAVYKQKSQNKETLDLGYVKKRSVSPDLWTLLKTGAAGACVKQIVEIAGDQFGVAGKNFAIIYVADRRPVTLPSLSNEADKKFFQRLAERDKAVELAKTLLKSGIDKIEGRKIEDVLKNNAEFVNKIISALLGYAG